MKKVTSRDRKRRPNNLKSLSDRLTALAVSERREEKRKSEE